MPTYASDFGKLVNHTPERLELFSKFLF
jgi:hypothetical protein